MTVRLAQPMHDSASRYVEELVPELRCARAKALRLSEADARALPPCTSRADDSASSKELTPEQRENVATKERFRVRCREALGEDMSVRDLALFFGVKRSKLHERMRMKRTDLAPLAAWFEKLDRYEDFQRAADEFLRTA